MARIRMLLLGLSVLAIGLTACGGDDEGEEAGDADGGSEVDDQPDAAAAVWVSPLDGDTVGSPVEVEMGATEIDIVEAGASAVGEGHLHVLVDIGCASKGEVLPGPSDEAEADGYVHFGDGSTSGEVELEPGSYELCLQLGDGAHRAFGTTDVIQITVE